MTAPLDPLVARKTWRTAEPVHAAIYFAAEAGEEQDRLAVPRTTGGYFASRAAPMGAVTGGVVASTFFNFEPGYVDAMMDGAWEAASPSAWLEARLRAADRMFARLVTEPLDIAAMARVVELARAAAERASEFPEGRPLFAGHASLPWPDGPNLALWHAQSLLREFRGDGHIACLVAEGLTGVEALVTHAASGETTAETLRRSRRWGDDEWSGAVESLRSRGLLDENGDFTEAGRALRQRVEDRTDELAAPAYEAIGEDGCDELRRLVRPLSKQMATVFG
ncbi:MAG: hypothetical protein QNM02_14865 [Acidimicrobiia bacterium]|nr:hypothetical protein [Acidimicrobiia bacterium]